MAALKQRPRDLCDEPEGFGKVSNVRWKHVDDHRKSALLAAQLQHRYAIRIRARAKLRGMGLKNYATEAGSGYDRLVKMLRGDVVMRLEDLAIADLLLGQVSEFGQLLPRAEP